MKTLKSVVFFGSLWGLVEASLGLGLQFLTPTMTGLILFPIGFYFMKSAQKSLGKMAAPLYVALVASGIKLTNLFFSAMPAIAIINPAMAIILEGLFVCVFLKALDQNTFKNALMASVGWRMSYLVFLSVLFFMGRPIRLFNSGLESILTYVFIDALIGAGLVYLIDHYVPKKKVNLHASYAFIVLIITIILVGVIG